MNTQPQKVLLIFPPDVTAVEPFRSAPTPPSSMVLGFPLGLGYIAAYLRKYGHYEVQIFDAIQKQSTMEDVIRAVASYDPAYIGMTTYTMNIKAAVEVAKQIKNKWGDQKKIIAGGPHASDDYKNLLTNYPYCDFVVIGEGEKTALELLQQLDRHEGGQLQTVAGLAYRDPGDGTIVVTKPREYEADLDNFPYPARDLVEFNNYIVRDNSLPYSVEVMTSRGCSHRCIFCSFQKRWRARSHEAIIDEIKGLTVKYPAIKMFALYDDNFSVNRNRVIELCKKLIAAGLHKYKWHCLCRVDQVDQEMLEWMKKAGCIKIAYGLESADPAILRALNKKITLADVTKAFHLTARAGIDTLAYVIAGSPGETLASIRTTYEFLKKLECPAICWNIMQILPGTALSKMQAPKDFIAYLYEPEVACPSPLINANIAAYENPGLDREQMKLILGGYLKKIVLHKGLHYPMYAVKKIWRTPGLALRIIANLLGRTSRATSRAEKSLTTRNSA